MYHIYHTQALIITGTPRKEADRLLTCLTRELGMIYAIAQGVRKETSKLRYALQDFSVAHIEVVQGKATWRVTNATPGTSIYQQSCTRDARMRVVRVVHMCVRLLRGEEAHPALYDAVVPPLMALATASDQQTRIALEHLCLIRLLFHLGYVDARGALAPFVSEAVTDALVADAYRARKQLTVTINQSLSASQL